LSVTQLMINLSSPPNSRKYQHVYVPPGRSPAISTSSQTDVKFCLGQIDQFASKWSHAARVSTSRTADSRLRRSFEKPASWSLTAITKQTPSPCSADHIFQAVDAFHDDWTRHMVAQDRCSAPDTDPSHLLLQNWWGFQSHRRVAHTLRSNMLTGRVLGYLRNNNLDDAKNHARLRAASIKQSPDLPNPIKLSRACAHRQTAIYRLVYAQYRHQSTSRGTMSRHWPRLRQHVSIVK
jgi:hypothetical protein